MARVAVNPDLLRWARVRAQKSVEDLRGRFPRIEQWESQETQPTFRQLENYAKATYAPFGYFFLNEPPREQLPIPYFRTVRSQVPEQPGPNLLDTVQAMQRRQDWLRETLVQDGAEPIPFIASATIGESTEAVAERMRQVLGFQQNWAQGLRTWSDALKTLRDALDGVGVLVVTNGVVGNNTHRRLDPDEFRGFVLVDPIAPLVFVNGADAKAAQIFTLAHECAHLFFGTSAVFDLHELEPAEDAGEAACNTVAAEFLVPRTELQNQWALMAQEGDRFNLMARHFKVSAIVVARRALDLGLVTRNDFFTFYRQYMADAMRRQKAKPGGGDFYLTQNARLGRRFGLAVVHAAQEGRLPYREAYALTGLWGQAFDKYAAELQGVPRQG